MKTEQLTIETIKTAEFQQFLKETLNNSNLRAFCSFRLKYALRRNEEQLLIRFSKQIEDNFEKNLKKLLTKQ